MTQHITIVSLTEVDPPVANVWRDDQVVMWGFDPESNLAWEPDNSEPIVFAMNDPEFAPWPGTTPAPIGDPPASGPDQRFYVSMAMMMMPNGETARYSYTLSVVDILTSEVKRVTARRLHLDGSVHVIDPEIENQSQP